MALEMLNGFVLIGNVVKQDELSDGGIYTGKKAAEDSPVTGEVISIPMNFENENFGIPATEDSECPVKKGDKVMFKIQASSPIKIDNAIYYLIGYKSLIGKVI